MGFHMCLEETSKTKRDCLLEILSENDEKMDKLCAVFCTSKAESTCIWGWQVCDGVYKPYTSSKRVEGSWKA